MAMLSDLFSVYIRQRLSRRLSSCVPWDEVRAWKHELNIQADSYKLIDLFPEVDPCPTMAQTRNLPKDQYADSPNGKWRYVKRILPACETISTYNSAGIGTVLFDKPIGIPCLYDLEDAGWDPWMSLTPNEVLTLRTGTRRAKGDVIVAGLGLGHQLIEVSRRKQVKRLTLVEIDAELVNWLMPRIKDHLGMAIKITIGDAYKVLPKMSADVCLLDIFPSISEDNIDARDRLIMKCPDIKFMWAWGAMRVRCPERMDMYWRF